jgi:hypothetical protein
VSYEALREIIITYVHPTTVSRPDKFDLALTYNDIDNDVVTISSTDELIDAIEQFASMERPVLKIFTMVVKQETKKLDNDLYVVKEKIVQDFISDDNENKPRKFQGLVDPCVSVVTTSVESLKKAVTEAEYSANLSQGSFNSLMTKDNNSNNESNEIKSHDGKPSFIHGRHTCDACFRTPIVGLRFHSVNFPDYDLCADCRDNYKGTEILFETIELGKLLIYLLKCKIKSLIFFSSDCDRQLQEKWRRKYYRSSRSGKNSPDILHFHKICRYMKEKLISNDYNEMDPYLHEAIRRSIEDMQHKSQSPSEKIPEASSIVDDNPDKVKEDMNTCFDDGTSRTKVSLDDIIEEPENVGSHQSFEDLIEDSIPSNIGTKLDINTSFTSEAAGHSDVAGNIGITLDDFANTINEVINEIDLQDSSIDELSPDVDGKKYNQLEVLEDEWQVVTEDYAPVDESSMAQATYLIGSALFESDLKNSVLDENTFLTGSNSGDSIFLPEIVDLSTSSSSSIVPKVLYDRWSSQLKELHELGFIDDSKNVETLERIKAGYIGVDDDEEVSLAQVVNALLN